MPAQKPSLSRDDDPLLSSKDLTNSPGVSEDEALQNRALRRGPRKARPPRRGLLNISEPTLDRWVSAGTFPKPMRLGPRARRWHTSAVREWLGAKLPTAD
jgi:hypothetical protein